jgi:hypothetical protein
LFKTLKCKFITRFNHIGKFNQVLHDYLVNPIGKVVVLTCFNQARSLSISGAWEGNVWQISSQQQGAITG